MSLKTGYCFKGIAKAEEMRNIDKSEAIRADDINSSLRRFIINHFPTARRRELSDTDPLLESGIIDSLGVLDVVAFVESEFNLRVDDDDLTPENFQTVDRMTAYVQMKRNGGV